MRKAMIAVVALLCASGALAQQTQITVFTSNLGYAESAGNSQWSGGIGLALSRSWSSRWATELAVATEEHRGTYTQYVPAYLVPVTERRSFRVFPVDLVTQYRFTNDTRWTPYITGGVRYVAGPQRNDKIVLGSAGSNGGFAFGGDRTSAQIGIGTSLRITPHAGLRFDVNRLLRSDDVNYDPLTRVSIGVSWKF